MAKAPAGSEDAQERLLVRGAVPIVRYHNPPGGTTMPWSALSKLMSEPPSHRVGVEHLPEPPGGWTPAKWWFVAFSAHWGDRLTRLTVAIIAAATLLLGMWFGTRAPDACQHHSEESTVVRSDRPTNLLRGIWTAWHAGVRAFRRLLHVGEVADPAPCLAW